MKKEGWDLMDVVVGEYSIAVDDVPEKEVKIIGNESTKLVFAREKNEF